MIIATAGHIDHGKTALVNALTGVDTDRLPEEKSRGITIDLGFAYAPLDDGQILGFIDVPGHERFVRNMLAGVSGIDFALLVVAADDGPKAQTLEHLAILDLLGVARGAVALTKTDIADGARIAEVETQIRALLAPTGLADAPIFPVSARTGAGMENLRIHIQRSAMDHGARAARGHFRHAIDRVFTLSGAGLVVTGTAFSGSVSVGDRLLISPSGIEARVRAIHAQNQDSQKGMAGQRLGINIAGPDVGKDTIRRGDWLLASAIHAPVRRFDASLRLLGSEQKPLAHWTRVHVHLGAAELLGHVALLEGVPVAPGGEALVQLVLDDDIGALAGDRFILRDASASRTMAGGTVIDPFAPSRGRAKPERLAQLEALRKSDAGAALAALSHVSPAGVALARFCQAHNLPDADMAGALAGAGGIVAGFDDAAVLFAQEAWEALAAQAVTALAHNHEKQPDRPGIGEQALRRQIKPYLTPDVFRALAESLIAKGRILRSGPHLLLPGHRAEMSAADKALWARAEAILREHDFTPPVVHEMARLLAIEPKPAEKLLVRAERFGLVYRVAENRFFLTGHVRELAELAETMGRQSADAHIDISAFRDTAGIGRNLAVQLLEYFDRAGLTARLGDVRRVQRRASEVFPEPAEQTGE